MMISKEELEAEAAEALLVTSSNIQDPPTSEILWYNGTWPSPHWVIHMIQHPARSILKNHHNPEHNAMLTQTHFLGHPLRWQDSTELDLPVHANLPTVINSIKRIIQ
eukprot:TRINITY_DN34203_c0_g1_i1.p1 TRINITY_DN34203_c0_g1~~TRINITY_DN34203_c0_g1_i1.p1  ORF type:complete len:107 (+),score=30.06 TRINITY_DN34203_c0_g1_i1:93-413(+)